MIIQSDIIFVIIYMLQLLEDYMKNLLVYYSFTGNNQKLVNLLKTKLSCDVLEIKEKKKRGVFSIMLDFIFKRKAKIEDISVDFDNYHKVIFAAPVWCGMVATPMKTFLANHKNQIKNYYFVSFCGGGATEQVGKLENQLCGIVSRKPLLSKEFWIIKLLPKEQQSKLGNMMKYRLSPQNFEELKAEIDSFMSSVLNS